MHRALGTFFSNPFGNPHPRNTTLCTPLDTCSPGCLRNSVPNFCGALALKQSLVHSIEKRLACQNPILLLHRRGFRIGMMRIRCMRHNVETLVLIGMTARSKEEVRANFRVRMRGLLGGVGTVQLVVRISAGHQLGLTVV